MEYTFPTSPLSQHLSVNNKIKMKRIFEFMFFSSMVALHPKSKELPVSWLDDLWRDLGK